MDVVGLAAARRLALTGASVAGGELERLGLVTRLLPGQAAMRVAAAEAAARIAAAAPLSLRAAKAAFFELSRRDAPPDCSAPSP